ncbi:MAG: response regulator [Bryobacteraceae bacterium]
MGIPSSSRSQVNARILMVDDNSMGLMARKTVLEDHGYEVVSVRCPDEALEKLRSRQHFDLLITDFRMPAMTGVELITAVREHGSTMPAILLSGFAETLGLGQKNTGADVVIQKNANEIPQLLRAVRSVLRGAIRRPAKSEGPAPRTRRKKA